MYQLDKSIARKILIEEERYGAFDADQLLADYPPIGDALAQTVEQWLQDRQILDVQVEGLTIQQIMDNRQYHFLVAVKALNRLLDPSRTPEQCLRLRNSLSRPVQYL